MITLAARVFSTEHRIALSTYLEGLINGILGVRTVQIRHVPQPCLPDPEDSGEAYYLAEMFEAEAHRLERVEAEGRVMADEVERFLQADDDE